MRSPKWESGKGKHGGSSQGAATTRKAEISIFEGLQDFIRYLKDEKQASPYTLDAYERDLLRFAASLSGGDDTVPMAITSVTSEDVRQHMHALIDRKLSTATVRRAMYALGSFFGWALRWGLVPTNPIWRITVPRRERVREVRSLSRRERALLVAAADRFAARSRRIFDRQAPALVRVMLKAGLRRGEAIDLRWRDLDLAKKEVLVRFGKGRKSRRVPVEDAELLAMLRRLREDRQIDDAIGDAPVFVNTRGKPMTCKSFYGLFHRVLAAAELAGRGITPHTLRHYADPRIMPCSTLAASSAGDARLRYAA